MTCYILLEAEFWEESDSGIHFLIRISQWKWFSKKGGTRFWLHASTTTQVNSLCSKSFDEFKYCVNSLKLTGWQVSSPSIFNYDQIHSVPKFEIYVEESLNFSMRCLLWSVPVEHELYGLYKQLVKNITISNLVSCLSYRLCPGLTDQFAGGCIEHTVPRVFTLSKTPSPLFQTKYYRSSSCQDWFQKVWKNVLHAT